MLESAWSEEPFRKSYVTSGWVCYSEQVVDMCCSEPDTNIPYYNISVIKGLLFINQGVSFFFFVTGKTCTAEEPKEVLLSDFYVSSSLTICQDKYCKHEWRRYKERKRLIREGRSRANGEAVRKRAKEYLERDFFFKKDEQIPTLVLL